MRGEDLQQHELFSYGSLEERVPANHPLRPIRTMVDEALKSLDGRFKEIYDEDGRKSIPPERLLRALLQEPALLTAVRWLGCSPLYSPSTIRAWRSSPWPLA